MRNLALALCLLAAPALGQALPVVNPTGPNAAAYGAEANYPVHFIGPNRDQKYLVGAFSHNDALQPGNKIAKAPTPTPFARAAKELSMHYRYQNRTYSLADYLDRNPTTGLLILRDNTILFEHYQYARTENDRFVSQSMAKTFTAMLIGIAVAEGKIKSIDDTAETYVPELKGSEIGKASIRALLHMSSGIAYSEIYDGHDDSAALSRALWRRGTDPVQAIRQFNTREAEPDTHWHYKGLDTATLGLILRRATGQKLADQLSEKIWSHLGTEADADWSTTASGLEAGFCCISATLRDYARFGSLLAHDGAWAGQQLIPAAWVQAATTAERPNLQPGQEAGFYGYGYQTWLVPGNRRSFALLGVHGQAIYIDPITKLVLVHTAVRPKPAGDPGGPELVALWRALVAQTGQ
jgi:CubicO group peptidase (beta-lactamase class C family)